jgi:hypothetical protein
MTGGDFKLLDGAALTLRGDPTHPAITAGTPASATLPLTTSGTVDITAAGITIQGDVVARAPGSAVDGITLATTGTGDIVQADRILAPGSTIATGSTVATDGNIVLAAAGNISLRSGRMTAGGTITGAWINLASDADIALSGMLGGSPGFVGVQPDDPWPGHVSRVATVAPNPTIDIGGNYIFFGGLVFADRLNLTAMHDVIEHAEGDISQLGAITATTVTGGAGVSGTGATLGSLQLDTPQNRIAGLGGFTATRDIML